MDRRGLVAWSPRDGGVLRTATGLGLGLGMLAAVVAGCAAPRAAEVPRRRVAVVAGALPCGAAPSQTLLGVSALSASDAWAVGVKRSAGVGAQDRPLALRWDGARWRTVRTAAAAAPAVLYGVAMVTADDVWAVGTRATSAGGTVPLAERWNGRGWRLEPVPRLAAGGADMALLAVAAAGPRSVVVAGAVAAGRRPSQPLMLRWDGRGWQRLDLAPVAPAGDAAGLVGVAVRRHGGAVAVGSLSDRAAEHGLLVVGGGPALRAPSLAGGARFTSLTAVAAVGAGGLVVIGTASATGDHRPMLAAAMLRRGRWITSRLHAPGRSYSEVSAVAALAPGDVWAAGAYGNGAGGPSGSPLVERWQGRTWRALPVPDSDRRLGADGGLDGVAAASPVAVWAVGGSTPRRCGPTRPLVERWDGRRWRLQAAP